MLSFVVALVNLDSKINFLCFIGLKTPRNRQIQFIPCYQLCIQRSMRNLVLACSNVGSFIGLPSLNAFNYHYKEFGINKKYMK